MKKQNYKWLSVILSATLIFSCAVPVLAEEAEDQEPAQQAILAPLAEEETVSQVPAVDNQTTLADGTYSPENFTVEGGTGKVKITCDKIIIKEGKSYGEIGFSSIYYEKLQASGMIFEGEIDEASGCSIFREIPISLNTPNTVIGTTTAMSEAHDITYTITVSLSEGAVPLPEENEEEPGNEEDPGNEEEKPEMPDEEEEPPEEAEPVLIKGSYLIKADTDKRMFYLYEDEKNGKQAVLKVTDTGMNAVITLTGTGYDYLYMGSAEEAEHASKSSLSKYKVVKGYYTYTLPVSKLDTKLVVSAHSKKYDKWYEHTITFYSNGAKRISSAITSVSTDKKENSKQEGQTSAGSSSQSSTSSGASTGAVRNETGLADGTYTPDQFSWSGGTGRLAYISCNKIIVRNGKTYAEIQFSSSSYDLLKAAGATYSKIGTGLSTFVIPVKLNENNTIIGRTVAMSEPHWITYSIYIYSKAAERAAGTEVQSGEAVTSTSLAKEVPQITGLTGGREIQVDYAEKFKLFAYDKGITLLQMDITTDSALTYSSAKTETYTQPIYDEEGNLITRSQGEITKLLYQKKIVNYLLVPEDAQLPAGLDKEFIIINLPAEKVYGASKAALYFLDKLGLAEKVCAVGFDPSQIKAASIKEALEGEELQVAGSYKNPDYKVLVKNQTDLAFLPITAVPEETEDKEVALEKKELLEKVEERFTTLGIPIIIDRSSAEEDKLSSMEWIKVYGAIFDCQEEAEKIFKAYEKTYKEKEKE